MPTRDADAPDPGLPDELPVDSDVDVVDPAQRADVGRREATVIAAVALGGIVGAEARYGLAQAIPHAATGWPWSTLLTNVIGSVVIGVLMVVVLERRRVHHLVRPFVGVGICGGFTTFSTFAVDTTNLLDGDRPYVALGYVAASLLGCFAGTALAFAATRSLVAERRS